MERVAGDISGGSRLTGTARDALYKELWHACAGPLVTLPREGERAYYFPEGHMEQADPETDEVYAQITLLPEADQTEITSPDSPLPEPQSCNAHSFCKTLTASDTSTHGGFSVLRRHADDCLPALESSKIPIKSAFVDLYIDFHKNRHIVFYCCRWCLVLTSSFLFQHMSQHSHPGRNGLQLIFVAMNGTFVTYFVVSIMLLLHGASNFNGAKYSITDNVGNLVAIALFSLLSALYV